MCSETSNFWNLAMFIFSYGKCLDFKLGYKYGSIKFSTCVILIQILLLAPKGMMVKFWMPMSKLLLFNKCSWLHFPGLGHTFGSLWIPNTFINTYTHQHTMHLEMDIFGSWIFPIASCPISYLSFTFEFTFGSQRIWRNLLSVDFEGTLNIHGCTHPIK
jgi:hypothetical protein